MYMIFLHATTHEGLQFMDNRAFVESALNLTLEDQPSVWWSCSVMLNFGY